MRILNDETNLDKKQSTFRRERESESERGLFTLTDFCTHRDWYKRYLCKTDIRISSILPEVLYTRLSCLKKKKKAEQQPQPKILKCIDFVLRSQIK